MTPKLNWDIIPRANTMKNYFSAYNHIINMPYPSKLFELWNQSVRHPISPTDAFHYQIYKWCAENLQGNVRCEIHRACYNNWMNDWEFDEFGGDEMFVAFQKEEDIVLFMLRWA